jgi:hypothetical protein
VSIGHGSGVIDKAWTDRLVAQVRAETTLNRDYNVPLAGGISTDGKTIYVDKAIPDDYDDYLRVHEFVEKRLLDSGIDYLPAHAAATAAELAAVEDDGIDIDEYDRFWDRYEKVAAKHKIGQDTPPDLEMKPYTESNE